MTTITMKKSFLFLLLATAAFGMLQCVVSCNNDDYSSTESNVPSVPKVYPGTYKFEVSVLKGQWEEGDKILVRGTNGSNAQTITLTKDDISADKKTATAKLGEAVTSGFVYPDGLYAAYPADAVRAESGTTDAEFAFETYDGLLAVAYLAGDTFAFKDASSYMTFSLGDGYDSFTLVGNMYPGLCYNKTFYVTYSSADELISAPSTDGNPFREGTVTGSEVKLWFPGGFGFTKGYTIYAGKDGEWPKAYTVNKDASVWAGTKLELGDITSKLQDYTGPGPRMPKMGQMTRYPVKFNELSGICLSEDQTFIWGVGDDGSIAKISLEGQVLSEKWIGCDLEAISRNTDTEDLIVGIEDLCNPSGTTTKIYSYNGIGRIPSPDFNKVQELFRIDQAKNYNNAGIEGVSYYKDGLAFAGAQADGHLFLYNLESGEKIWDKRMRSLYPAMKEIADICYDPLTDWMWIIDSEAHKIFVFSDEGDKMIGAYALKTRSNEESLFVDHAHSCVWVGDDAGSTSYIYKYDFSGLDEFALIR